MQKENIKLLIGDLEMVQGDGPYRHAIDPFLLCAFGSINEKDSIIDLGTASGVIPLILSAITDAEKITGIEIQPKLAEMAKVNVVLNQLEERVDIVQADIRSVHSEGILLQESYSVVFANPPYRKTETGKISPEIARARCRHEVHGGLEDFLSAAFYLLRNKGRCNLIYLPERLPELLKLMQELKIEPKRLRCVHSMAGSPAVVVMVEGRKNSKPGLNVEPPLYIYDGAEYSEEVREIFQMDS